MPSMQCTPNTSSASSYPNMRFKPLTDHRQTAPTIRPKAIAPIGPTQPQAGVIATSPATAPDAAPSIEGLPLNIHSRNIQDNAAAAVATKVLAKTMPVVPLASRLEPALKPNQPTHSSDAPIIVIVRLCGA